MTITKTYSLSIRDFVHNLSEQEFNELRDAVNSAAIPAQGKPLSPPSYPHQIRIPCQNGSYAVLTTTDPNSELTIPASCGIKSEQEVDPYAELKKAHAEGKTIQFRDTQLIRSHTHYSKDNPEWKDASTLGSLAWNRPIDCYRVKPEPTEPKAEEHEWIGYKNEVPSNEACPLDPKTLVVVKCRDGTEHGPLLAEKCAWSVLNRHDDIVAYRIAKQEPIKPARKSDGQMCW